MAEPQDIEVCRVLDAFWREPTRRCDPEVRFIDLPGGGWLRFIPGVAAGEFASITPTRISWASLDGALTRAQVRDAESAMRTHAIDRAFVWVPPTPPAAWTTDIDAFLRTRGAIPIDNVRYVAMTRRADSPLESLDENHTPCPFAVRVVTREEAPGVLGAVAPWFGAAAIPRALRRIEAGAAEFHAAFAPAADGHGETPVAIAAMLRIGDWAYLGWAGTDPAHRGRGAQTALLRARVRGAALSGALWCVAETVTAEETSLRNLVRAGFAVRIDWRVYRWDVPGSDG